MRFDSGWIKLHRCLKDHPVAADLDSLGLFAWLLLNANWKPGRAKFNGKLVDVQPGQLITGRREMAERLGCPPTNLERRLAWLETCGSIGQQTSRRGRIITILNWSKYQESENDDGPQVVLKRTTTGPQPDHNRTLSKEEKKERRKDIPPPEPGDEALAILWHQWACLTIPNLPISPKWADTIRKMRTIDGFTLEQLGQALEFVKTDPFWKPNALSVLGLRSVCKDGLTKIQNIVKKLPAAKKSYFETEKFL